MAERKIPDRSAEPALQESLDHSPDAATAANSDDVQQEDARDDEGNVMPSPESGPKGQPSAREVEEKTGVPESSEELSDI